MKKKNEINNKDNITEASDKKEENNILLEKINKYEQEIKDNKEKYLIEKAEVENLKKRMEKDLINIKKYALKDFAKDLLNILDSLEQGLNNKININDNDNKGIKLIQKMFIDTLKKYGINKIVIKDNTQFDPLKHEVISIIKNDNKNNNTIINILQNGYTLNEHVLKYAKVIISKKHKDTELGD